MTAPCRDKLLALIRSGLDQQTPAVPLSEEEWNALLKIGARQSILPILYRGLKRMGGPEAAIRAFDLARLQNISLTVRMDDAIGKIGKALDGAGIPYILLKGAVLRHLYPEKNLRTSCDVDVLVHEEDLDRAVGAIEERTGFVKKKTRYHDVALVSAPVCLELHFNIRENMAGIDELLDRVWDHAVLAEGCRYELTPEYQLFHVIAHMSYHMVHGGLGIRNFLDLWLLRTKTACDAEAVRQMCAGAGVLTFYEACCNLVDGWMAGRETPSELTVLESYVLNGGVFGTRESQLASQQRQHRGLGYFFRRVFMSRDLLATEYPILKEKPYLLPVCQIKRWIRLLDPKKRRQVKQEISSVKAMSAETIDSFDQLLASLGL